MKNFKKPKAIVILGPTASGKSSLAVLIAKKFNGEVISADSRQVYKNLDIGTGKITKKEMRGIPHHLLDIADPKRKFTVTQFKKKAEKAIEKILKKGKLPIICGGTGFYIQSVVQNIEMPDVKPNRKLRKKLGNRSAKELFETLQKLDPERAQNIDSQNPRRLIRAIEVAEALGKVPKISQKESPYEFLQLGIKLYDNKLRKNIASRLKRDLRKGMIVETEIIHRKGVSWKRMDELGLEYKNIARFLRGEIDLEELKRKLEVEIWRYAKRQKTWFKRDKRVKWIYTPKEAEGLVKNFLKS